VISKSSRKLEPSLPSSQWILSFVPHTNENQNQSLLEKLNIHPKYCLSALLDGYLVWWVRAVHSSPVSKNNTGTASDFQNQNWTFKNWTQNWVLYVWNQKQNQDICFGIKKWWLEPGINWRLTAS
jgi:hypothetical protein